MLPVGRLACDWWVAPFSTLSSNIPIQWLEKCIQYKYNQFPVICTDTSMCRSIWLLNGIIHSNLFTHNKQYWCYPGKKWVVSRFPNFILFLLQCLLNKVRLIKKAVSAQQSMCTGQYLAGEVMKWLWSVRYWAGKRSNAEAEGQKLQLKCTN